MSSFRKNVKTTQQQNTFQRIERMHPHKMLLFISILGSSLIFLFMLTAYAVSAPELQTSQSLSMPKSFVVGTILLLTSSFVMSKSLEFFRKDDVSKLLISCLIALLIGLSFSALQLVGWVSLDGIGVFSAENPATTFLYVISALHLVHLLIGLVLLGFFSFKVAHAKRNPVKWLVTVTNPYEETKLQMLTTYWHFLDISWLVIFLFFLFMT